MQSLYKATNRVPVFSHSSSFSSAQQSTLHNYKHFVQLPMADHKCQYREDDTGWKACWADWGFPIAHFLGTVAITLILLEVVDDSIFPIHRGDFSNMDSQANVFPLLTQSAVTSIISLALVYHRLAAGSWLTLAGWRMAFIVLEVDGASLSDLNWMINYRRPPFQSQALGREIHLLPTLWLISLLATPSLFISPLLTGAVNWIPTQLYQHSNETIKIPHPGPSNNWNENNLWSNNRMYEVYNAVGLASVATSLDFNLSFPATSKRYFPWFPIMPPNSTVAEITLPIFRVNSFQPVRDKDEIFEDFSLVDSVISDQNDSNQNFSTADNLFSIGTEPGRLTLVHTKPWQASEPVGVTHEIFPSEDYSETTYEYPAATVVTERKLVVMAMQFHEGCTPKYSSVFGSFQDFYAYESVANSNHRTDQGCYVFFYLNYTAGIIMCKNCPVQSDGVTPGGLVTVSDTSVQILPDGLVETAIAMMPDVLFYTNIANSSFGPTFNNVEGYVRGMLSIAYQASWNCLARSFVNDSSADSFAETTYRRPVPGLVAHLSKSRVVSWCILNALLTASACLLHFVQRKGDFKAVVKPWLTALFLDASSVVFSNIWGLCNARKLEKHDRGIHVKLECSGEGKEGKSAGDEGGGLTGNEDGIEMGERETEGKAYKHPILVKMEIDNGGVDDSRRHWKWWWQRAPGIFRLDILGGDTK